MRCACEKQTEVEERIDQKHNVIETICKDCGNVVDSKDMYPDDDRDIPTWG